MTGDVYRSPCGAITLHCGDYREVLADVEPDACIVDPPYGARTHNGQRHGRHRDRNGQHWISARALPYAGWDFRDVARFVARWADVPGWLACFTDHALAPAYDTANEGHKRTRFAPLACVQRGMNVRLAGDGPSNWTTWLMVSRPKSLRAWGTLPGAYVGAHENVARGGLPVPGAKPLWLMRAIVRDYSKPGDLVCDPCAGGATTLLAAAMEGRRAIGAELDPATYAKAVRRLEKGYTPALRWELERAPLVVQDGLPFGGDE